ncbi:MAG TPA: hypothetical protein VFS29_02770 [Motilibacteraceae bacterium]|nr:hypothetical protein [Motilibacteraceae bacterium]
MTVRWPFKVAVVLLVLGLAAVVAVPRAAHAWQTRQDRQRAAALAEQMAPTASALVRLSPPPGATSCGSAEGLRFSGDVCWLGTQSPGQAALAMQRQLRQVDARDVLVRCVRRTDGTTSCGLQAMVANHLFSAMVTPPFSSDPSGLRFRLSGNATTFIGSPGPGTPVPPEQA